MSAAVDTSGMVYPMQCLRCYHVHDAGKVEVVQRYTDCSVWRCPNCSSLIDDRPRGWGGSAVKYDPLQSALDEASIAVATRRSIHTVRKEQGL